MRVLASFALAIFATAMVATPAAADGPSITCAGITTIPDDAVLASDAKGSPILILSTGGVIRCDGTSTSTALTIDALGLGARPTATAGWASSTFEVPAGSTGMWTLWQRTVLPNVVGTLVGFLGSSADMGIVFWRSTVDGPIETWIHDGITLTP
jgi:hypothetical protein